jgi:hypothetical protein
MNTYDHPDRAKDSLIPATYRRTCFAPTTVRVGNISTYSVAIGFSRYYGQDRNATLEFAVPPGVTVLGVLPNHLDGHAGDILRFQVEVRGTDVGSSQLDLTLRDWPGSTLTDSATLVVTSR